MIESWKDPQFAKEYMENASDVDKNWYEHSVNLDSVLSMIPDGTSTILDFGCGPGDFTAQLKEKGYKVDGCDGSRAMVELAKQHFEDISFFVWDGVSANPNTMQYDAIVSKLTLHFVEDLEKLATLLASALNVNGHLIVSVPHPLPTIPKAGGIYLETANYETEIGTYGMHVTMIHRSIQDYINPFLENGFVLTRVVEPSIPADIIKKYDVSEQYAQMPRRLNLRFQKNND